MATKTFMGFDPDTGEPSEFESKLARKTQKAIGNTEKAAFRTAMGIPASAEGLVPSQNLADVDSAATSRSNLDVYSQGEVNAHQLSKAPVNAAVFNGSTSVLSNADASDLLVGGDGTSDNKLFARFAIYIDDLTSGFPICGRFDSAKREWFFSVNSSGYLFFQAYDDSAVQVVSATATTLALVTGRWYVVEVNYDGAGGASAMDGVTLRVNGVDCSVTVSNSGSYVAMEDKGGSFRVGEDNNGGAHSSGSRWRSTTPPSVADVLACDPRSGSFF